MFLSLLFRVRCFQEVVDSQTCNNNNNKRKRLVLWERMEREKYLVECFLSAKGNVYPLSQMEFSELLCM